MATYCLCPLSTFMSVFNNSGLALTNGLIWTYGAGTSTPTATWTDATGGTPNSNPIQLSVGGNLTNVNIWQKAGIPIKVLFSTNAGTVGSPVFGTQIGPTFDNVVGIGDTTFVQSNYYGGADTGSANAYVLNFTANFTAYSNGLAFYWIPANTNTGASTLNVNGLGAINLVNVNGAALGANQILANQPAQVVYYGGNFILTSTGTPTGSFTGTVTGMTSTTTGTINWTQSGPNVTLYTTTNVTGTSNTTGLTLTGMPSYLYPAHEQLVACWGVANNGTAVFCQADIGTSGTITFGVPTAFGSAGMVANASGFTNSGSKGLFIRWQVTYSLL